MKTCVLALLATFGTATAFHAQSLADVAKAEAERRATAKPATKVITNADLPSVPDAPIASATNSGGSPPSTSGNPGDRQEAITSLRAVQSVLAGGANTSEFKKYYLEAKIKVDALANTPENASIKEVTRIYADATTLMIAGQINRLSASDVRYFKRKYAAESTSVPFLSVFKDMPDEGFYSSGLPTWHEKLEAAKCQDSARLLLDLAQEKFQSVK